MKKQLLRTVVLLLVITLIFNCLPYLKGGIIPVANASSVEEERLVNAIVLYVGNPNAYVNNERKMIDDSNSDIKPIINNSRTLVPLRFVVESLGADIKWNAETETITILLGNKSIELQINSKIMRSNEEEIVLDVEPEIIYDRTFVPIRAVTEAFGKKVFFDRNLIIISDIDNIFNKDFERNHIDNIINRFTQDNDIEEELSISEIAAFDRSVVMIFVMNESGELVSQGSGFCIGKGLFLTNYHVVEGTASSYIVTNEQNKYDIEGIVKFDEDIDLAIVKTKEPIELDALKIGSKDSVKKGDKIIAIGSPEGLQNTISDGIISGFRQINDVDLIQITAPITHGSSGGPLFNMYGYVIGVNTSGFESGNLNFAVAIDYAKSWINELKEMSFSHVSVLKTEESKIVDSLVSDEEILKVIYANMKALEEEDAEAYMDTIYLPTDEDYVRQKNDLLLLFMTYDLDTELEDYEIIEKRADIASIKVVQKIKYFGDDINVESVSTVINTLEKHNGEWKIINSQRIKGNTIYTEPEREAEVPIRTETDISNIHVDSVTEKSAHISWETNTATVCKIEYGTSEKYGNIAEVSTTPSREHSMNLTNLREGIIYHYRIYYKDENGNFKVTNDFTFTTRSSLNSTEKIDLSNIQLDSINLSSPLKKIVYNAELNKAYGIDNVNKRIVVIDLEQRKIQKEIRLAYKPSDLCVVNDKERMYIVNEGSSFITELSMKDYKVIKNISWKAPHINREYHFHIYYQNNALYIVDGQWAPGLWRIKLDDYKVEDLTEQVNKIGDIVFANNGKQLYYWHQYGWDAGWAGSNVYKYSVSDNKFTVVDETDLGYPDMDRDPLDTPIILIESKNLLICKKYVFNMNNLKEVYYTFPEEIYAVDPEHKYVVGKENIYDLEFYDVLTATPKQKADQYFFDNKGNMYMLVNEESKLFFATVN